MTDDLHTLAAAYALDALDPDERRRFEAHYPDCPSCAEEVADYRRTAARLGAVAPAALPESLKARVMDEVGRTRQLPPKVTEARPSRWVRPLVAVAAVVVALAVAGGLLVWRDDGSGPGGGQTSELAAVMAAPDARTVSLDGSDGEAGTLRVVYSRDADAAVVVGSDLPDPGDGRTYQLWSIRGEDVTSAGVFTPGESGSIDQSVALPDRPVEVWGVTNEPSGGSPAPTTDIVFKGTDA